VGASVKAPKDAQVIDAAGQFVMPGIIDCHSHIAVDGSVNEGSISVSSIVNIADVLNPDDVDIYRDLAGGRHGRQCSARQRQCNWRSDHRDQAPLGTARLEASLRRRFGPASSSRWAKIQSARIFSRGTPRYPRYAHGCRGKPFAARLPKRVITRLPGTCTTSAPGPAKKNLIPPRRDLRLDPLVEVLEGKRYVHSHCYREDEILMLLRVAKEFGFKVRTFQHVLEGYKVADEIAAAGAGGLHLL